MRVVPHYICTIVWSYDRTFFGYAFGFFLDTRWSIGSRNCPVTQQNFLTERLVYEDLEHYFQSCLVIFKVFTLFSFFSLTRKLVMLKFPNNLKPNKKDI